MEKRVNPHGDDCHKLMNVNQDHSIMDEAVPAFFGGQPLYIRANIEWV